MTKKRYGMVIDLRRCFGCQTCVVGCIVWNSLPKGIKWNHVDTAGSKIEQQPTGTFPNVNMSFLPHLCNHCEDPACVNNCPTGAMHKREDGIVLVDQDKCVGCGYCTWSCPYGVPIKDPVKKVMSKCTLCVDRIEGGQVPFCVADCPGRARIFGDLNDPDSQASRLIANRKGRRLCPEKGTSPSVYYVGP
ncbi:4Fe-4S dicluster domain-containing protein [Desulfitobacterium hafniense]|nr:4Fe-4S dicluster domain-containing protein [Desulfitobacterium hafniense]